MRPTTHFNATIKALVLELIHQTNGNIDYRTVTKEVKKCFPDSKWKESHWGYYRSQITSERGRYKNLFSMQERANLQSNKKGVSQQVTPMGFIAERMVRSLLGEKFKKRFYTGRIDRTLVVGQRSNGELIKHEFDLVSEDKTIIGEVKSDKYTKRAHSNTRFFRILGVCKYLEMIAAEKKMLILTNEEMYKVMKHDLDGLISSDIEIIHINLKNA